MRSQAAVARLLQRRVRRLADRRKSETMEALKTIGWLVWLLFSMALVFEFVGYRSATNLFPEGRRAWHLPAQLAAMALFAAAAICNPWA
jgi:polyferredoxin